MLKALILRVVKWVVTLEFVKRELNVPAKKIIALYTNKGFIKEFVTFRFWFGPLHELNALVPRKGKILELGCGEGIVSNFLAINSSSRQVTGMEIVAERVKEAEVGIKNAKFVKGNILKTRLPKADSIILSHVLHHLPGFKEQVLALKRCHESNGAHGKIYIAEVNKNTSVKYLIGWLVDVFLVPVFFEHKLYNFNVFHRNFADWITVFNRCGFSVAEMHFTSKRIYPEVIFVLQKKIS